MSVQVLITSTCVYVLLMQIFNLYIIIFNTYIDNLFVVQMRTNVYWALPCVMTTLHVRTLWAATTAPAKRASLEMG